MNYYTHPQTIQLEQAACPGQGVYLRWLSPLNNWEGWLFAGDFDVKTEVRGATTVLSTTGRTKSLRRPGYDVMTVRSGLLTTDEHKGLTTLLDAPKVYQQTVSGGRTSVYVVPGTVTRTSSDSRHEIQFDLELPARNSITN